jgi:hypothetical protein
MKSRRQAIGGRGHPVREDHISEKIGENFTVLLA